MNKLFALFLAIVALTSISALFAPRQGSLYSRLLKRALLEELQDELEESDWDDMADLDEEDFEEYEPLSTQPKRLFSLSNNRISEYLKRCVPRCAGNVVYSCPDRFGAPVPFDCGYRAQCQFSSFDNQPHCFAILT
eukprot:TRINITY_DN1277_c0_g1_i1.p1 TRINITY_DN1277_c0_g1~~TRINITY_DN1277_c0_g1_i1.p1  ORF type:complete len:136 (-),score=17.49 TRINITY_DN1277_c0_g1_i1:375-782(-)